MSEENVEIIRAANAAASRWDVDALTALCDPEVEFDWSQRMLDANVPRESRSRRARRRGISDGPARD